MTPLGPLSIRRAQPDDHDIDLVAPLFDAYRQFYGQVADVPLARRFIAERLSQGESVIFLATTPDPSGATAVGFVQLYPLYSSAAACRIWMLNDLYVIPPCRAAGVARALMDRARAHAVETGAKRLILDTAADNERAQRLYRAQGYLCQNDQTRYYTLDLP